MRIQSNNEKWQNITCSQENQQKEFKTIVTRASSRVNGHNDVPRPPKYNKIVLSVRLEVALYYGAVTMLRRRTF